VKSIARKRQIAIEDILITALIKKPILFYSTVTECFTTVNNTFSAKFNALFYFPGPFKKY